MATKIFKSGNLIIINRDSVFDVINLPSFDYKFIGTTYVSFIDKFSNEPNITDLIVNIQDEAGTPIGTTEQDIIDYLAVQTKSSISEDIYYQFTDASVQSIPLPSANVEYILAAFRLKVGITKQEVDKIIVDCHSLSNDDIRLKLSINKNLSAAITAYFQDVHADSSFQSARVGRNGMPTGITVTGVGSGRDIRQTDINSGSSGIVDTGKITATQGIIFLITAIPFSNGGSVRDTQNWSEKQ
jgi:hypothetical protein